MRAEILDFFREAVFFLMRPVFTDLSRIFCTFGMNARASLSFFSATSFLTCLTALFKSSFFRILNPRFRPEDRRAFFADVVIGMRSYYTILLNKSTPLLLPFQVRYYVDMIGHLTGHIIHQDLKSVILDVKGVGYKVYTNTAFLQAHKETEVSFWTYLAVRETALDLYGFKTKDEIDFFELLISVSGIGPKSALGILSIASIQNLRHAISSGDTSHLVKVSGIGKKNAEKIVIELKDKLDEVGDGEESQIKGDLDALEALKSLGYGEREARGALKKVSDVEGAGEKIRKALKLLS